MANKLKFTRRSTAMHPWLSGTLLGCSLTLAGSALAASCLVQPPVDPDPPSGGDPSSLPRATLSDFSFIGGFTLPAGTYGESATNYASAVIEKSGNSLFMVGHNNDNAIAEFIIPPLVNSRTIGNLNSTGAPVQNFSQVLDRGTGGNSQGLDTITGLEVIDGSLVVNAVEYYDAPANNVDTSFVVENAGNLASSTVKGPMRISGAARSAGWMTELTPAWRSVLGTTHLAGNSSGTPIIGRHSVGPSAHAIDGRKLLQQGNGSTVSTKKLLEFSLDNRLANDLLNDSRNNDLWTHTSRAAFGFVVPGTRTYATFGFSSGFTDGVGYKITQDDGNLCSGYCSRKVADNSNYFWFWDMNDLVDVMEGRKSSYDVRPYSYGKFNVPYQTRASGNGIGGGTFDESTRTVYFSVKEANDTLGPFSNPPVIAAYRVRNF